MMFESFHFYKMTCACGKEMTAGTLEDFWHTGWSQENIFGQDFELCAECTADIKKFLNVEDEENDRTTNDS